MKWEWKSTQNLHNEVKADVCLSLILARHRWIWEEAPFWGVMIRGGEGANFETRPRRKCGVATHNQVGENGTKTVHVRNSQRHVPHVR